MVDQLARFINKIDDNWQKTIWFGFPCTLSAIPGENPGGFWGVTNVRHLSSPKTSKALFGQGENSSKKFLSHTQRQSFALHHNS
jgi:hypothetical protein